MSLLQRRLISKLMMSPRAGAACASVKMAEPVPENSTVCALVISVTFTLLSAVVSCKIERRGRAKPIQVGGEIAGRNTVRLVDDRLDVHDVGARHEGRRAEIENRSVICLYYQLICTSAPVDTGGRQEACRPGSGLIEPERVVPDAPSGGYVAEAMDALLKVTLTPPVSAVPVNVCRLAMSSAVP